MISDLGLNLPSDIFVYRTTDPTFKNWDVSNFLEILISGFTNYEPGNTGPPFPPSDKLLESVLVPP